MLNTIIYKDNNIILSLEGKLVYLKILEKKYDLSAFQELLMDLPRIKITQFNALKAAFQNNIEQSINIGEYKPLIEISVSNDKLKAYAFINLTKGQFESYDKKDLIEQILLLCKEEGITTGIDISNIAINMMPSQKFLIAKGVEPIPGEDAKIILYEVKEIKPQLFEDGTINHYELNIINQIEKDQWIGERIEPTAGIPGISVYNAPIPSQPGKQLSLLYDKKSIYELLSEDSLKTILMTKRSGAVVKENGMLSVSNYIEIGGNVSFETGNLDFDGHIEIKNTVEDNFCVRAENDIQILGELGLGGVDTIESRNGNIYIRGGISGKNKAQIICNGDLYTKFAADCTIICNGTVNIGYYSMNANIKAKEVIFESLSSKIIGGSIEATIRIAVSEVGNRADIPTRLYISGFDRQAYEDEYKSINLNIEKSKEQLLYFGQKLSSISRNNLDHHQQKKLHELEDAYQTLNLSIKTLYEKKKKYTSYLHCRGDGEIRISKRVFSNVTLQLKDHIEVINQTSNLPLSLYLINDEFIID